MREDPPGPDYSDHSKIVSETHEWMYRLGDIVSALAATGLRIEYLHEFAECIYPHFPFMKQEQRRPLAYRRRSDPDNFLDQSNEALRSQARMAGGIAFDALMHLR